MLVYEDLAASSSALRVKCLKINPFVFQPPGPSMPFTIHVVSMLCWYICPFVADSFFMYFLSFDFFLLSQPPLDPLFVFQKSLEISYLLMASLNVFSLLGIKNILNSILGWRENVSAAILN